MEIKFDISIQDIPEANLNQYLASIEQHLLDSTKDRFNTMIAPNGTSWQPLSPAYYARKPRNKALILTLDGYLRRSIYALHDDSSVTIGSNMQYAATHQFGKGNIPARPFIGLSRADQDFITNAFSDWATRRAEGLISRLFRRLFSF